MANISKLVRLAMGLFLLTAAGLKAHGIATDTASQDSLLLSPRLLIATIEIEIVLGLWLLSGAWPTWCWRIAVGTFSLYACISGYSGWIGQASCNCFGAVRVSPWYTFGLDIGILT